MNSKLKNYISSLGKNLLVLTVLDISSLNLLSQQVDVDKSFWDVFNLETENINLKDSNSNIPIAVKAILPDKFTDSLSDGATFSIGISDPEANPETAFQQAYYRALMLGALQQKSQIKMVSENFAQQKEKANLSKSKYEEMYHIEAMISLNDSFPVIDSYRLPSQETLVLIAFPKSRHQTISSGRNYSFRNEKHNNMKVSCSLYHLENIANRSQQIFRTDYETSRLDTSMVYPKHEKFCFTFVNSRWCKLSTSFDNKETERPNARYYYYYAKDTNQKNDSLLIKSVGATTSEGLWPALITGILWQMSGNASGNTISFKEVSEYYNQTVIHLNSTVENKTLRFNIKKLLLDTDCLYSILDIEKFNSEKK